MIVDYILEIKIISHVCFINVSKSYITSKRNLQQSLRMVHEYTQTMYMEFILDTGTDQYLFSKDIILEKAHPV